MQSLLLLPRWPLDQIEKLLDSEIFKTSCFLIEMCFHLVIFSHLNIFMHSLVLCVYFHHMQSGLTPLHLAAQEDKVNVAQVLLNNGADVNPQTKVKLSQLAHTDR